VKLHDRWHRRFAATFFMLNWYQFQAAFLAEPRFLLN
jgi:hypothetical protein